MATRAVIALGSNLGDRLAHLQQARDALCALDLTENFLQSSIYQTAPVLCPDDSPDFFNAVISIDYLGTARELHQETRAIELSLGRCTATERNAPRVIDLDILLFGDEIIEEPELSIPHPRLHLRRFVLEPLCEIHPHLMIPGLQGTIQAHLSLLTAQESELILVTSEW
jgi:2-amino-4-hydroxy-6-hydroxymethyldihydropteridine diphosphokinase